MPTKTELQEGIPINYAFTAVLWATGSGKTGAALRLIASKPGEWVILTNETLNIKSIKEEAVKRGYADLIDRVHFYCYASLHKVVELHPRANLLLDEVQTAFTDLRLSHLEILKPRQVIVTTATLKNEQLKLLIDMFGFSGGQVHISKRSLRKNISDDILPDPVIKTYELELDHTTRDQEYIIKAGKGTIVIEGDITERWSLYNQVKGRKGGYIIKLACTEKEYYDTLCGEIKYNFDKYFRTRNNFFQQMGIRKGLDRAKFLAKVKEEKTLEICEKLQENNVRYLAFSYSVEAAKRFSDNAIHSKNTKKKNEQLLDEFNSGKVDNLAAFKMLNAGVNLVNIEQAVFQHLEKKSFNFIQKVGRALRSQEPVLHFPVVRDTVDIENFESLRILLM